MPNYTYFCDTCKTYLEHFCYISEYKSIIHCPKCNEPCERDYITDVKSQSSSVKKADSELKTIGDLANRNRDKLTEDQKIDLYNKHNSYKQDKPSTSLPKGMKRIKKPNKKTKWI